MEPRRGNQSRSRSSPTRRLSRRGFLAAGAAWFGAASWAASQLGCAGYRVGHASLYPMDIQTVHVPVFESTSFRRNLGERLTEAVVKEIEAKTPYKVVGPDGADSTLRGRIFSETKRATFESPTDEPRVGEVVFGVTVSWVDRRGDLIAQNNMPMPPDIVELTQSAQLVPEVGHSIAVAHQTAISRLAAQIVGLMEAPW